MSDMEESKRDFLLKSGLLLGALGISASSMAAAGQTPGEAKAAKPAFPLDFEGTDGPIPWFRRIFHLYTGPDGLTIAEQLPLNEPKGVRVAQLLRRTAHRVTLGGSSPGAGYDFHVANHPTLLIPLFGSMQIELHDGSVHELIHGDLAFAEDCTGKGHISRAGRNGSFMAAIQLPKEYCPTSGSSDRSKIWQDPA